MNNKQSFTRGIAALMVFGLALATPSAAREQYLADRSAGVPERARSQPKPWPAPVGHRQPRASDIPSGVQKNASDAWLEQLNRRLDRDLRICRGC